MEPSNNSDFSLITGGVEMTAHFQDGTSELVKVREVPIKAMERYLVVMDNEPRAIALFCNKTEEWVDLLTAASHSELIERGEAINRPLFDAWYQRRLRRMELLTPGFRKRLENILDQAALKPATKSAELVSANSASPSPSETT